MTGARLLVRRGAELLAALVVAVLVGGGTLAAVSALPFVEPSWLPETFGATLAAGVVGVAGWLLLRRATGDRLLWLLGTAGPAFLASSHLGLMLNGTPHYLFGLGGDQLNRVAYLTRFASSPELADPFYADAAPFYPPQWFWVGGRLAWLLGVDGWEFYKPYAIVTMAIAGAIAFVAWRWLVPTRPAVLFGLATAVVGGHTNAYEPYSWILICLLPQVVVATFLFCARITSRSIAAVRTGTGPGLGFGFAVGLDVGVGLGSGRRPVWPMVVTIGAYLGWAAMGYTLIAGFAALLVGLVVLIHIWVHRRERTAARALAGRLFAMAGISAVIALLTWHPYLLAVLGGTETESSVANDFAPEVSSRWPLPMFEVSASGLLCLIGVVWLVVTLWPGGAGRAAERGAASLRARIDGAGSGVNDAPVGRDGDDVDGGPLPAPDRRWDLARAFGLIALVVIGWFVVSGLRAVLGSTLLPFRMIPAITLALALAGIVGALALARWALATSPSRSHGKVLAAAVVVAGLAAVQMVQHVSEEDAEFSAVARAAPGPPSDVLGAIDALTPGRSPSELVVLTSAPSISAYRPYFTFQAPAQAYATPTGRYEERLDEIRRWADTDSSAELAAALDSSAFRGPDVLVLNTVGPDRWVFPATVNAMPLTHNNTPEEIVFRPEQFTDPSLFEIRVLDSRVVIARR